jgi:hypothetical protein
MATAGRGRGLPVLAPLAVLLVAVISWPSRAQAVEFTGPTDFPAGSGPFAIATADFNGDSDPDLAVANQLGDNVSILLGSAGGTFTGPTNYAVGHYPSGIAAGDFNGDSDPDLAVADESGPNGGYISILLGSAGGTFTGPTNYSAESPSDIVLGDFDRDLDLDLAAMQYNGSSVTALLGDGAGGFGSGVGYGTGDPFTSTASGLASADLDADGDLDLAVTKRGTANSIAILRGSEGVYQFLSPTQLNLGFSPGAIASAKLNGDSDPDLVVADPTAESVAVLFGTTGVGFSAPTPFSADIPPASIAVGNFNSDTYPDLALAGRDSDGEGRLSILIGDSSGGFGPSTLYYTGDSNSTKVAAGDFDGGGHDVAVTNYTGPNVAIFLRVRNGYARPRGASPAVVRLVPAFTKCASSNATHGAPLASPSCSPPTESSAFLTSNAPDRDPPFNTASNATAYVQMRAYCIDGQAPECPLPGEQEDVKIDSTIADVRCRGTSGGCALAGGTYGGKLLLSTTLRITDRGNGPAYTDPGTVMDVPLEVDVQCSAGECTISTSADAVMPGMVQERRRTIWQLGEIQVLDGGADGDADTTGDNTLFLEQGLFAP